MVTICGHNDGDHSTDKELGQVPRAGLDISGKKYGKLTVIRRASRQGHWVCRCDCGKEMETRGSRLRQGTTKSCGCLRIRHGHSRSKALSDTYVSWKAMKARCGNSQIKSHGARGIKYDPRWKSFKNFLADMGERPTGRTLDRIDVMQGYSKQNCRWATILQQANNKRGSVILYYDYENYGAEATAAEWARWLKRQTNNPRWTSKQLKTVLQTMTLDQLICALDPHGLTPQELKRRKEAAKERELNRRFEEMLAPFRGPRLHQCPVCGRED
jgi:hypothetical protein